MVLDRDKLKKLLREKGVKNLDDFNEFMRGISMDVIETLLDEELTDHLGFEKYIAAEAAPIAATYVCPHQRSSGCKCIKPNAYFLEEAEREFGIDLRRSFVIGDHPHDVELATHVGATGIYVLSGHGMKHRDELPEGTEVAAGIMEAVEIIRHRAGITQMTESERHTNTQRRPEG
jgi:histidinol phosphatase-like enzyme